MKKINADIIVCIAGKNNVACDSLAFLANSGYIPKENILVLLNLPDQDVDWMKSLKETALEFDIKIAPAIEELYTIDDLTFISLEYNRIIHPSKFNSDQLFNIHFSKLPAYKGMYTSAWPILNGEKTTGVTLHKIDRRIDGGEIIDQIEFPIDIDDNCRDLYFNYNSYGAELFKKNIAAVLNRSYQSKPQPVKGPSYYSKESINYGALEIDLKKTAFEVHNQIRAFVFPEYQLPKVCGHKIIKSDITSCPSILKPGKIVCDKDEFIEIATIDYNIRLFKNTY